jgi:adenosyl cobinamide kinase/adenosyl cobinamide phosphate guanylyltransferase
MNAKDEEQEAEFRSLLEKLRQQLLAASVHFDVWVQLFPTTQVVDVINQYKGFFQPTREAHLDQFFIKVSNVVSNDPRSPSFHRIFKMLDNNPALASGVDVQLLRKRLEQHKEVLERIKKHRNKRAAHWDTQEQVQRKPVLLGESKRMLEELQGIFNEISGAHSKNVWSFKYSEQSDSSSLLNVLTLWRELKLVSLAREVKMGKIEELSREEANWMVKKQELEQKHKALGPKVARVSYGEELEAWVSTPEKMAEIEKVDNEIKQADAKLKEIREKLKKLKN